MRIFPIIPIWLMLIICIILTIYTLIYNKNNILIYVLILLVFVINLRPMYQGVSTDSTSRNNLDILFVIDTTYSMKAEDYGNGEKRIKGVKDNCKTIVERFNGARFSIITFDSTAQMLLPFTNDIDLVNEYIDYLKNVKYYYANGSTIELPIDIIEHSLDNNFDNRERVLIFMSDGENVNQNFEYYNKDFKNISKKINAGLVLGYGTTAGGMMKAEDTYGVDSNYYVRDYSNFSYKNAISKIDEGNLKKIARDLKAKYIHMDSDVSIEKELNNILNNSVRTIEDEEIYNYHDIYFILVIPIFFILTYIYIKNGRRIS